MDWFSQVEAAGPPSPDCDLAQVTLSPLFFKGVTIDVAIRVKLKVKAGRSVKCNI